MVGFQRETGVPLRELIRFRRGDAAALRRAAARPVRVEERRVERGCASRLRARRKRDSTTARPAAIVRARSGRSSHSVRSAATYGSGARASISAPDTPDSTISGSPETFAATTGTPIAIASIGAIGSPSQRDGSTSAPALASSASARARGSAPSSSTLSSIRSCAQPRAEPGLGLAAADHAQPVARAREARGDRGQELAGPSGS